MAITINGKTYRNLQEQVEENVKDIEDLQESQFSGDYNDLSNKPEIPDSSSFVTTNTSQNISGVKTFKSNPNDVAGITMMGSSGTVYTANSNGQSTAYKPTTISVSGSAGAPATDFTISSTLGGSSVYTFDRTKSGTVAVMTDLPPTVSGTHNTTNWVNLTIGNDTYSLIGGDEINLNQTVPGTATKHYLKNIKLNNEYYLTPRTIPYTVELKFTLYQTRISDNVQESHSHKADAVVLLPGDNPYMSGHKYTDQNDISDITGLIYHSNGVNIFSKKFCVLDDASIGCIVIQPGGIFTFWGVYKADDLNKTAKFESFQSGTLPDDGYYKNQYTIIDSIEIVKLA